jgi:hypothetical protein
MELTPEERARITDSKHKIQSVTASLTHVDPQKIPDIAKIEECLEDADESLRVALGSNSEPDTPKSDG